MQVMKGTKREITLFQWGEEDTAKVNKIKQQIEEVIEFMNKHGIK